MTDNPGTLEPVKFEQKLDLRLNELRKNDQCCDVRFEINGKIFPCHRVVLIAFSPYFNTMLNSNFKESSSDIISLKEIEAETFEEILNAIYTGNIRLFPSNAYFVLKASHLFLLKAVEEACVSYIKRNRSSVHYLVEICWYANNIQQYSLHSDCIVTISNDLVNYGQIDSFTQIPVDMFDSILQKWHPKSYEEEFTIMLISKWCEENGSKREDCERLFESSQLQIKNFINPKLMARAFTMLPDDTSVENENENQNLIDTELSVSLDLNLYLNVFDTKTGQKGWGVLKTNDKFDTFLLSSFHPSHSSYKNVCQVGSKMYCFEYFADEKRNVFSCYDENNDKMILPVPEELAEFYQMASMDTSIYLMKEAKKRFIVWVYDCDLRSWSTLITESDSGEYDAVLGYTFLNGVFYIIVKIPGCKNDSLISIDSRSLVVKRVRSFEISSSNGDGYKLYGFDNELAVHNYAEKYSVFDFFNVESEKWSIYNAFYTTDLGREKFCLIHHKGFVYALENSSKIVNDRFDLLSKTVEQLPFLPKRITHTIDANSGMMLVTGQVFGAHSKETKN